MRGMSKVADEYDAPTHRQVEASDRSWFIAPPYGWRHPVTGRRGWQPDPLLLAFGQYIKRARYLAGVSQVELSKLSGVDQGALSRLERALAPAMKVERLVKLSAALGRMLPLGYCPHEHWCQWQRAPERAPDPPPRPTWEEFQVLHGLRTPSEILGSGSVDPPGDPRSETTEPEEDFFADVRAAVSLRHI
jgi:transcriptional regulator with XRE-family HTH domain